MDGTNQYPSQGGMQQPSQGQAPMNDAEQNKVLAIIGYLGILFLVPMLAAKNSPFAQYHAKQGMVLFIASVIWFFAQFFLMYFLAVIKLSFITFFVPFVWLGFFVLMILGIVSAAKGEMKPLPLIGGLVG